MVPKTEGEWREGVKAQGSMRDSVLSQGKGLGETVGPCLRPSHRLILILFLSSNKYENGLMQMDSCRSGELGEGSELKLSANL